jgi:hypothetical protein
LALEPLGGDLRINPETRGYFVGGQFPILDQSVDLALADREEFGEFGRFPGCFFASDLLRYRYSVGVVNHFCIANGSLHDRPFGS